MPIPIYAEARYCQCTDRKHCALKSEPCGTKMVHGDPLPDPIGIFAMGIVVAEGIRQKYKNVQRIHWRQLVLLMEMLLLLVVGFLPTACDLLANAMVSFACAMQVQTFRKVNGYAFASTMCIGNIRSGMESLCVYGKTKDKEKLYKAGHYLGIIGMFAVGAAVGGHLILLLHERTIWVSCGLLFVGFLLMFIKEELEEHPQILEEEQEIRKNIQNIREEAKEVENIIKDDLKNKTDPYLCCCPG